MLADQDLVDFHVHSTASDGTHTPEELLLLAGRMGVRAIALCDHDTVEGLDRLGLDSRSPVVAISGVEVSCQCHDGRLHILGLGILRLDGGKLSALLSQTRRERDIRNRAMVTRLASAGVDLGFHEVMAEAQGQVMARPHFARALLRKGAVRSLQEAFDRFLGDQACGYVPKKKPEPETAVEALHDAGALAIVAHPGSLMRSNRPLEVILDDLVECGIDGIEAHHPDVGQNLRRRVLEYADKKDLLVSGGSDYHGENKENSFLGRGNDGTSIRAGSLRLLVEALRTRGYGL